MGTSPSLPNKSGLSQQLWDVVTTLTPEAQNAGLRKAEELGFDLNRGRIPLAETLINLEQARATLLDLVEQNKLGQIPLKIQYSLLAQVQRVGQNLQALLAGTDTIQALEDSVDDLITSIWQYNLQNLSGELLGFVQKMNQLKRQETLIREVHRQAEAFSGTRAKAEEILLHLSEIDATAGSTSTTLTEASSRSESLLSDIAKNSETAKSALAEIETNNESTSRSAEACAAAAEKASGLLAETETAKHRGAAVVGTLNEALQLASKQLSESRDAADALFEKLRGDCERTASSLQEEIKQANQLLTQSISLLRDETKEELDAATVESRKAVNQQEKIILDLVANSESRLEQAEKAQNIATEGSLQQFEKLREVKLKEIDAEFRRMSSDVEARGTASIEQNDGELSRLTAELETLEGQIRESINRATGYSLFHSFQKRQEDLAKAKLYWAYALAVTVVISLIASGFL